MTRILPGMSEAPSIAQFSCDRQRISLEVSHAEDLCFLGCLKTTKVPKEWETFGEVEDGEGGCENGICVV